MLQHAHFKQGLAILLADAAPVATTSVWHTGAPVDARGLVTYREDGSRRMESSHLRGEELTNGMEDEPTNSEEVYAIAALKDAGNLFHFISLDVHSPEDGEVAELLLTRAFQLVLGAQHGFILEKHAACSDGAGKMVDVGAAETVTAVGGTGLLAACAARAKSASKGDFYIDECTTLSLVDFGRPQSTVKMHPQIDINVKKTS